MTKELREAIKDGYSAEFVRLLMNFGLWSRYFGCEGYKSHHTDAPTAVIEDDTALTIDRAVGRLKLNRPNLYMMFRLYWIQGMNEYAIMHEIRQDGKAGHHYFNLNPSVENSIRYLNAVSVREMIIHADRMVLSILEEMLNEELHS